MKRIVTRIFFILLLVGMFTLAFNIQPVKSEPKTWIVDDDGSADFQTIQEAIDAANDGDTIFVLSGTYPGFGIYSKSISVIGENRSLTVVNGECLVSADSVRIENLTVSSNAYHGISIFGCNNCDITGNIVKRATYCLRVTSSRGIRIVGNVLMGERYLSRGISLSLSEECTLKGNEMSKNYYNFGVDGLDLAHYTHDIDTSNTVEGKSVCYIVNRNGFQVPQDAGFVAAINSTDIISQDMTLSKNIEGVLLAFAKDAVLRNLDIHDNEYGVRLRGCNNITISDSNITRNYGGIGLSSCEKIIVRNNYLEDNTSTGIGAGGSNNSTLEQNSISGSYRGVSLATSSGFVLRQNLMVNNSHNFEVVTVREGLQHFIHDIDDSNTVNGKPIYYLVNGEGISVPASSGYIAIVNSTRISCEALNLTHNGQSVLLAYSQNCSINRISTSHNMRGGINIYGSYNCTVGSSSVLDGITMKLSTYCKIIGNAMGSSYFEDVSSVVIAENQIHGMLQVYDTEEALIHRNLFLRAALYIRAKGFNVSENTFEDGYLGMEVYYCEHGDVFHNNFINHTVQVRVSRSTDINWDDGFPSGGNYWSDYKEMYPNATEIDDSGIWDTPYVIDENNQDNYPLMEPWTAVPPTINATADIIPNTLNLKAKPKYVMSFIELPEGYNISDIDVSTILINGTIPVDLEAPTVIGDYDNDAIPDLMVKFDGAEVREYILDNTNLTELVKFMPVTLTITGKLYDGTQFQGSDIIRVMMPGPRGRRFFRIPI